MNPETTTLCGDRRAGPPVKRVVILQRVTAPYRDAFYEALWEELHRRNVELLVVYGQPDSGESMEPSRPVHCARVIRNRYLHMGRRFLFWQPAWRYLRGADLIVLQQATRNLFQYVLLPVRRLLGIRLAFWGHGRNLQSEHPGSLSERWKKVYSTHVDHWFAYTDLSRNAVASLGYPDARITCLNNTIDVKKNGALFDSISEQERQSARSRYNLPAGAPTGVFCSRLYHQKRLDVLLQCVVEVKKQIRDFHLFVIGDGPDAGKVRHFARENRDWVHWVGAHFGREKAILFSLADVHLMPGPVGLHIVESFAFLTPLLTTRIPTHGPEIAYLQDGINGMLTENSLPAYTRGIVRLLQDASLHDRLVEGCRQARNQYTLENMVFRFAEGVCRALDMPRYR